MDDAAVFAPRKPAFLAGQRAAVTGNVFYPNIALCNIASDFVRFRESRPASMIVILLFMIPSLFAAVLLVGDLFHPFNVFAVEGSRDGDMRHRGGGRGSAPMLYLWRAPDHVARPDLLNFAFPFPGSSNAGGHEQVLSCRVNVPGGSGPRLEGDIGAGKGRRILCREQGVNTDISCTS